MNYGKFFRLNKNLSRIEDGFAIYDYIDLPAYFAPSMDNKMSPKYPISLMITSSSVILRLHYSAYKIEEGNTKEKDLKYPKYYYDYELTGDLRVNQGKVKPRDMTKIAHMEEVVLELPYMNTVNKNLADTIKSIYNTEFPQKITDKEDDNKDGISTGGRYLEKLIRKRYLEENIKEGKDIHSHLYHSLRRISDGTPSYSTLWLMGLVMGEKDDVRYLRTDKKGNVVGFLRKLLLDFMFDLKHSDVFQNSAYYQNMYSGLMSDFYFSALMHKCEYYYYRKLIRKAIDDKHFEDNQKNITTLYAEELFRAEELWVKDIMSPQAEIHFDYNYTGSNKYLRELFEKYHFSKWSSWFAEPEEEMKRVCFTMSEKSNPDNRDGMCHNDRHICNGDVLVELLDLDNQDDPKTMQIRKKMIESHNTTKHQISQWFYKRYDFNDAFHLHFFKYFNFPFFSILCITLILLFASDQIPYIGQLNRLRHLNVLLFLPFFLLLSYVVVYLIWLKIWGVKEKNRLVKRKHKMVIKSLLGTLMVCFAIISFSLLSSHINIKKCFDHIDFAYIISAVLLLFASFCLTMRIWKRIPTWLEHKIQHPMSNLHLLFPRLVASITAAWLTITTGFDFIISFFSEKPSWETIFAISIILLVFVMYEVNRITPKSNAWLKLYRSLELTLISYFISLTIGIVVINFLGEKFLERGGFVGDGEFYTQYVKDGKRYTDVKKYAAVQSKDTIEIRNLRAEKTNKENIKLMVNEDNINKCDNKERIELITKKIDTILMNQEVGNYKSEVAKLDSIYHTNGSMHPLTEHISFFGWNIFILRDFLIMFSFIAMFIGIFIQLIIFGDNKQMTEL